MRKDFGAKPLLYPMPVLMIATYAEDGTPDVMNAAWGAVADNDKIFIALSGSHRTVANMLARKAFTVSPAVASQVVACDYAGIVSANDVPDKFARAGFHAIKSQHVDAPLIAELPMALECELISFDPETEYMFGRIVNVCADESVLDEEGGIDTAKVDPLVFDTVAKTYRRLGDVAGRAFHDGAQLRRSGRGLK